MPNKILLTVLVFAATLFVTHAAIFEFDIVGRATSGLSGPNETASGNTSSPATGTELNPGISYDDSTHQLTLHFGWGSHPSAGGGIDLTGDLLGVSGIVIQGPSNPDGTTSGGVLYDLSANATDLGNNGRTGLIDMSTGNSGVLQLIDSPHQSAWTIHDQEQQLESGGWYLNIASSAIQGGEIRGQLAPVPEPAEYAMLSGLALLAFAAYRRHKRATCE